MLRAHVAALDIVQITVVGLAHHHVHRARGADADIGVALDGVGDESVGDQAHVERIGERDGALNDPQLAHLLKAKDLAKAVDGVYCSPHLVAEQAVRVGQDHGHAGAHRSGARAQRSLARDQGGVPHAHPCHVGDRIVWARFHPAHDNTRIPHPRSAQAPPPPRNCFRATIRIPSSTRSSAKVIQSRAPTWSVKVSTMLTASTASANR